MVMPLEHMSSVEGQKQFSKTSEWNSVVCGLVNTSRLRAASNKGGF